MTKVRAPLTNAELEAFWRPNPSFIGPVAPPMVLWLCRGRPRDAWEIEADRRRAFGSAHDLPLFGGAA